METVYNSKNTLTIGAVSFTSVSAPTVVGSTALYGVLAGSNTVAASTGTFSGNVGVGTTSPGYILDIGGFASSAQTLRIGATSSNACVRIMEASDAYGFSIENIATATAGASGARMDIVRHSGTVQGTPIMSFKRDTAFVGIGTTNPSTYTLEVTGSIGATADIVAYFSDERLKTKTGALVNALDKVCTLDTFTYTHNDLARSFGFTDNRQYVGISAQQVRKVQPEVVRIAPFDADGENDKSKSGEDYITVQYERLVPLLVEAIKEEREAREALEERVKLLEQR
jgi:hypothetical protein